MIDANPANRQFLPDGRLAGNVTCNRLIATWEEAGDGRTITPAGATMMVSPPC